MQQQTSSDRDDFFPLLQQIKKELPTVKVPTARMRSARLHDVIESLDKEGLIDLCALLLVNGDPSCRLSGDKMEIVSKDISENCLRIILVFHQKRLQVLSELKDYRAPDS